MLTYELDNHESTEPNDHTRRALTEYMEIVPEDGEIFTVTSGTEQSGDDDPERSRIPVAGGVPVYEQRAVGKALIGIKSVGDWNTLADALAALGHSRGAVYHLDELNNDYPTTTEDVTCKRRRLLYSFRDSYACLCRYSDGSRMLISRDVKKEQQRTTRFSK